MSNELLSGLSTDGLEATGDSLGGFQLFESGLYDAKVKLAFIEIAQSGAKAISFLFTVGPREYRETVYFTTRDGQVFYEKNNKKYPLPGYTTVNDICLLTTGHDLSAQVVEEQVHNLYDFESRSEKPKKVQVLTGLTGQDITLGLIKRTENKQEKNSDNKYVPINEKRDVNLLEKVFHADSGKTVTEFKEGTANPTFKTAWDSKNTGVTQDRYKEQSGQAKAGGLLGGGKSSGGEAKKSLFG